MIKRRDRRRRWGRKRKRGIEDNKEGVRREGKWKREGRNTGGRVRRGE